jgi:hypothetical protein
VRRALVLAVTLGVLAGCGGPAAPAAAPPVAPSAPPSTAAPDRTPEQLACEQLKGTAGTVRRIAQQAERGPVLPAAVALLLFDPRRLATQPGVQDPELLAARAELVAAIDDLDAQGRALLPPGGNPVQNAVQLDMTRILAAVERLEALCSTPV